LLVWKQRKSNTVTLFFNNNCLCEKSVGFPQQAKPRFSQTTSVLNVHRTRCTGRKSKCQMLIYTPILITSIIHRIHHRKFIYMFKEKEMVEETWCIPKLLLTCFECKEMLSLWQVGLASGYLAKCNNQGRNPACPYIHVKCKMSKSSGIA
jgi:hypothetical protein